MAQAQSTKESPPAQGRQLATIANLFGNGANTLIVAIQAIVLTPLYLQVFGKELYGAWLGSGEVLNVLQLFDLGLTNVITQRIGAAHARNNRDEVGAWFASALMLMTILAFGLAGAAYFVSFSVGGWTHVAGHQAELLQGCFRLGSITTFLFVINFAALGLGRGTQDTSLINLGMVVGGIAGFFVTYVSIKAGCGLWSIPYGMITRNLISAFAGAWLCLRAVRENLANKIRLRKEYLLDLYRVTPATAVSGIAYVLTSQTEAAMVTIVMGRPEFATVLILTRRAVDVAAGLLNSLAYSCYGSFAHFVASDQRARSIKMYREILSLWTSVAIAAGAAYLAVNHSLVAVWSHFKVEGSVLLTAVMAAQMIVVGRSQLIYYLYRASGAIVKGSWIQFGENIIRFSLGVFLLKKFGLVGFGIAGVAVTGIVSFYCQQACEKDLREFAEPEHSNPWPLAMARSGILAVGAVFALSLYLPKWVFVIPTGLLITFLGSIALILIDQKQVIARKRLEGIALKIRGVFGGRQKAAQS